MRHRVSMIVVVLACPALAWAAPPAGDGVRGPLVAQAPAPAAATPPSTAKEAAASPATPVASQPVPPGAQPSPAPTGTGGPETPPGMVDAPAPAAEPVPSPATEPRPPPDGLPMEPQAASAPASEYGVTPVAAPAASPDAVFSAFRQYAHRSFVRRMIGASTGVVGGASMIAFGAYDELGHSARAWYIIGGVTVGLSALSYVIKSTPERMADQYGVNGDEPVTADRALALEQAWKQHAHAARKKRFISSGMNFVFSAAAIGGGAAVAAGAGKFEDTEITRSTASILLFGGAGAFAIGGVSKLVLESPAEASYSAFMAASGRSPETSTLRSLRISVAPTRGGAFAGAAAVF